MGLSYLVMARRRADTIVSYKTSLNANRNAAVTALWVTLGPMPENRVSRWPTGRYLLSAYPYKVPSSLPLG